MPIQQHLYSFFVYVFNSISCSMFFYVSLNFPMGIEGPLPPPMPSPQKIAGQPQYRPRRRTWPPQTSRNTEAPGCRLLSLVRFNNPGQNKKRSKLEIRHLYDIHIYIYIHVYTYLIYVYDMIWCNISCFQYEPWNKHSHSHGHKCFPRWSWASVWGTESLSISCHKMRAPGNFNPWGEHDR